MALSFALALLAGGLALGQASPTGPVPEAEAAVQPDAAAAPAPQAAPRLPGLYMNPFWLGLVIVSTALWLYVTSWVSDDAKGVGLDFPKWAGLFAAAGGGGLLLALLIHAAFACLLVVAVLGTFVGYIVMRNQVVPESFKFLGREHRARLLSQVPGLGKLMGAAPRLRPVHVSLSLTNAAGGSLQQVAEQQQELSDGAGLVADLLVRAGATHAQKVRLQPSGEQYFVQFLLDAVLHNVEAVDPALAQQAVVAVAQLASLSSEGRMRQGTAKLFSDLPGHGQVEVEVQVASAEGKPVLVLGLPDWTADLYRSGLVSLGMHDAIVKRVKAALDQRKGALFVCGPPGSGKTTTLYSIIGALDIFTTEVAFVGKRAQHSIEQVRHWSLSEGRSFAEVFVDIVRETPHIIALGDLETAEQARSLLGYASDEGMTMTALRAEDAPEGLVTVLKLANDVALVRDSVVCVLSQRLVRKLCTNCREQVEPNPALLAKLKIGPEEAGVWYRPVGCEACLGTGYHGRTGIFGMLILTDPVKDALAQTGVSPGAIRQAAGKAAFRTLYQDGLSKVTAGITTLEEVRRVLKSSRKEDQT
jgi:general secretion pathway protein E